MLVICGVTLVLLQPLSNMAKAWLDIDVLADGWLIMLQCEFWFDGVMLAGMILLCVTGS